MRIVCPSKTFLIGEYAVLFGGPAILMATLPNFSWDIEGFYDPHEGQGGFGASGAQFVIRAKQQGMVDPWKILASYKKQGLSGSGADIICQWLGGLVYFHPDQHIIEDLRWPFEGLYIGLIHTGYKIKTHEHIKNVDLVKLALNKLESIVLNCVENIKNANQDLFLKSITDYGQSLNKLGLVAEHTQKLLNKLAQHNFILAAKGCGAMGADVVLVAIHEDHKNLLEDFCESEKLNLVYCDNQFAEGTKLYDQK